MASGVASVWVPVDDMDRAVQSYGTTLGLTITSTSTSPEWSEIDANGVVLGLNGREGTSSRSAGGAVITFHPDANLDEEVSRLMEEGIRFPGGISDHEWGRIAPFQDSEGNDLQLYAPPA